MANNELTQHEKILVIIFRNRHKQWWRASDFQQPIDNLFIGYEASARMSELSKLYPDAFNIRQNGRFREMQFKFSDAENIQKKLPHELGRHLVREKIIR